MDPFFHTGLSISDSLKTVRKSVLIYETIIVEFMMGSFKSNDVFIIISLSGETKEGIEIAKRINKTIQLISFTRLCNNTIASLCEYNLYVSTQKIDALQITSYEVVGAFYALLDLLYMNYIDYKEGVLDEVRTTD